MSDTGPVSRGGGRLEPGHARLLRLAGAASLAVALLLIGMKAWGVAATGSVALLSSLADSLLDLVASLITFFALRVAIEPPDREHRFGHGKSEAVAGFAQAMIIMASALFVAYRALWRMVDPQPVESPAFGTLVMVASLVLTGGLVLLQRHVIRRTGSLAVSADAAHYQADLLTGAAVLVALFLSGYGEWPLADPLLGLAIAAVILISVRRILARAVDVLLDRELPDSDRERIEQIAAARPGVRGVHDLRTRSAGSTRFIQLHLEVDPAMLLRTAHEIAVDVERSISADFPNTEVLIHVDPDET